jgi:hypothetical protein
MQKLGIVVLRALGKYSRVSSGESSSRVSVGLNRFDHADSRQKSRYQRQERLLSYAAMENHFRFLGCRPAIK